VLLIDGRTLIFANKRINGGTVKTLFRKQKQSNVKKSGIRARSCSLNTFIDPQPKSTITKVTIGLILSREYLFPGENHFERCPRHGYAKKVLKPC
jgi:hypothetical protein